MGFLMGAYGKLMAGKYLRNLQYEHTQIQSQLRRVTKQFQTMQKMFDSQKRNIQNQMQAQYSNYMKQLMLGSGISSTYGTFMGNQSIQNGQVVGGDNTAYNLYNQRQMEMQSNYAMAKTYFENMFEMQQESMLQPIKDLEEDLQTRKDNLDSQIKIAEQEYNTYKEMEKAGAQNMKPEVTGQG